jgi:hypothetical protein
MARLLGDSPPPASLDPVRQGFIEAIAAQRLAKPRGKPSPEAPGNASEAD